MTFRRFYVKVALEPSPDPSRDRFWRSWGLLWDYFFTQGPPGLNREENLGSLTAFWAPFWGPLGVILPTLRKERKRSFQEGVWDGKSEAIAREWLRFSLFHRRRISIDFGSPLGGVLGAKFATILLLRLQNTENGGPKISQKKVSQKVTRSDPANPGPTPVVP